jgi:hypothetical protein
MGLDIDPQTLGRPTEAVLFCRPHGDELPAPRQQGAQFLRLRVRQGARRRTHGVGKVRQGAGLEDIRLGQLACSFGNVARLAGIDHHDRQTHRCQGSDHGPLIAPGGFEHHEARGHRLERRDEGGNPRLIIRDRPAVPSRTHGNIELGFGHINTYKALGL